MKDLKIEKARFGNNHLGKKDLPCAEKVARQREHPGDEEFDLYR